MKKLIFLFAILFAVNLYSGDLKVNFSKLQNSLFFVYSDNTNLFGKVDELEAVIYLFSDNESYPIAKTQKLILNDSKFEGNYLIDSDKYLFALVKIGNGINYDTKNYNFWEVIFPKNEVEPKLNTFYRIGLTYFGSIAPNIKRVTDYSKAIENFNKELEFYPDNIYAKIALKSLEYENQKEKDEKYYNFLSSLVKNFNIDKADDYSALNAIRIYRALGKDDKADNLEKNYSKLHPKSLVAEQFEFDNLKKIRSKDRFNAKALYFLKNFPNSPNFDKVFRALYQSYKQINDLQAFWELIDKISSLNSNHIINLTQIIEDKNFAFKLLIYAYDNFNKFAEKKEDFLTDKEYQLLVNNSKLMLIHTLMSDYYGLLNEEQKNEFTNFDFSSISSFLSDKFIDNYSNYLISKNLHQKALQLLESTLNSYDNTEALINKIKALYIANKNDSSLFKSYYDKLIQQKKANLIKDLKFQEYDLSLSDGIIQNMMGDLINIKNYKGKVILLEFWSTMINSTPTILSSVDSLIAKEQLANDFVFLPINVWEKDKNQAQAINNFLEINKLKSQVYFDNDNSIPFNIGLSGLPSRVFISKEGRIKFIENGFTDIESYIENLKLKLDYLR